MLDRLLTVPVDESDPGDGAGVEEDRGVDGASDAPPEETCFAAWWARAAACWLAGVGVGLPGWGVAVGVEDAVLDVVGVPPDRVGPLDLAALVAPNEIDAPTPGDDGVDLIRQVT